jgi:hypothetical protein
MSNMGTMQPGHFKPRPLTKEERDITMKNMDLSDPDHTSGTAYSFRSYEETVRALEAENESLREMARDLALQFGKWIGGDTE